MTLALTMGDPAGIAAEITFGAWRALRETGPAFAIIADPDWLAGHGPVGAANASFRDVLPVRPLKLAAPPRPGAPDTANAPAIIASIEQAVRLAQAGKVAAIVTNPISKSVLAASGFPHPGHTEFLASLSGCTGHEVMMLASPMLRVVPVTVHVALHHALAMLTTAAIIAASHTAAAALRRDFAIPAPRLAIAGLNPHAGENGLMGDEEIRLIQPAIDALRECGLDVTGPHSPDTLFTPIARARYDVAICMYHDQALIPLKTLDMSGGVNVTLGLPIVRTSPDHGTAFDIAGKGLADPTSLIAALRLADALARNRGRAT